MGGSEHKQDPGRVKAALIDPSLAKLVDEDYEEGIARGVARTPTVFVNGEPFIETFSLKRSQRQSTTPSRLPEMSSRRSPS